MNRRTIHTAALIILAITALITLQAAAINITNIAKISGVPLSGVNRISRTNIADIADINGVDASPTPEADYVIGIEDDETTIRDGGGELITQDTDFGAAWNTLNNVLETGDTVSILDNIYDVETEPTLTKSYITITGEAGATLKRGAAYTDDALFIEQGSHNTVSNIILDDDSYAGSDGTFWLSGSYNTVTNCTLIDCVKYGFTTYVADHFTITNNTVTKAQYGISGSDAGSPNPQWSSDGLIQGNTVSGCNDCCIKIKMWKDVLITLNSLDAGGPSTNGDGCVGIRYYHVDLPSQNVESSYNTVIDSIEAEGKGIAILVDEDLHYDWPECPYPAEDVNIHHNTCTVPYYGILIQGDECIINYNDCAVGAITLQGNYNTGVGNTGDIYDSGVGNNVT